MDGKKPGWQTSEFYLTLTATVVAMLTASGVIGPQDAGEISGAATKIVSGIVGAVSLIAYIASRTWIKKE